MGKMPPPHRARFFCLPSPAEKVAGVCLTDEVSLIQSNYSTNQNLKIKRDSIATLQNDRRGRLPFKMSSWRERSE